MQKSRIDSALRSIANDRRSGANELALKAVRLFRWAGPDRNMPTKSYVSSLRRLGSRVARTRPVMAPIKNVTAKLLHDVLSDVEYGQRANDVFDILKGRLRSMEEALQQSQRLVAQHYRKRFNRIKRPMEVSYSSQIVAVLNSMPKSTLHITVCESRPMFEGRRTARLLAKRARSVTVITEAQIALVMAQCDGVVLGCDSVYADGSVVNKTGSTLLALAARERRCPIIVVGSETKITSALDLSYESRSGDEVWRNAPRNIGRNNVYFERVPAHLIDAIVVESGVYQPQQIRPLWRANRSYEQWLRT